MLSSDDTATLWRNFNGSLFVRIPAGSCVVGARADDCDAEDNERPAHEVTIAPFYLAAWPVTLGEYRQLSDYQIREHSAFADEHAVNYISCEEADAYLERLNAARPECERDIRYRLPTEYEWEYACRAGAKSRFCYGDDWDFEQLSEYAWFGDCAWDVGLRHPQPVARKRANDFGLWDMHGNVWEWTSDGWATYHEIARRGEAMRDSSKRVLRGGSFCHHGRYIRASDRDWYVVSYRHYYTGFRLCMDVLA